MSVVSHYLLIRLKGKACLATRVRFRALGEQGPSFRGDIAFRAAAHPGGIVAEGRPRSSTSQLRVPNDGIVRRIADGRKAGDTLVFGLHGRIDMAYRVTERFAFLSQPFELADDMADRHLLVVFLRPRHNPHTTLA